MFEKAMVEKLRRIFGLEKVTFDLPGESREQQGIFIEVVKAKTRIIDAREISAVDGVLHIFANADKLPFGYFAKRISSATPSDTAPFFFGPEENVGKFRNIAERRFDFRFLFDSQYDPEIGSITGIDLSFSET